MSRRRSSPETAPPLEDEDLLQEILLRLPPRPSSLPRASAVCKRWRTVLSDPQFLKRFRKHHRKPPLLGFFNQKSGDICEFNPVLNLPDRIPAERFSVPKGRSPMEHWGFMGCRHGLAVLVNGCRREVVVWDPLTGQQHRVPFPPGLRSTQRESYYIWNAAVLCTNAEDGHVHGDCISGPFKLVLICNGYTQAFGSLYDSAAGSWGNICSTAILNTPTIFVLRRSILVGNALCWLICGGDVLVFDLEMQSLGVIDKPVFSPYGWRMVDLASLFCRNLPSNYGRENLTVMVLLDGCCYRKPFLWMGCFQGECRYFSWGMMRTQM